MRPIATKLLAALGCAPWIACGVARPGPTQEQPSGSLGSGDAGDAHMSTDSSTYLVVDAGPATDGTCSLGAAWSLATDQTLDVFGRPTYYLDGSSLPAGRYRVSYVDGCMKYSGPQDWSVNAYQGAPDSWWIIGATTADQIVVPPGTVGFLVDSGGFATFDECVAANHLLAPIEFGFDGGPLGVWLEDNPYTDNVAGPGGRNPKWALTLLGDCSQVVAR